jgi:hypothetical protein
MDASFILAVESVIPADHPVSILAVPLGLLFMSGSVYVLLWSNYGAKKAAGIYGVAFFGFSFIIGVFWWFGGPGIPPNLGITTLPGQEADHYDPVWYAFEPASDRARFFSGVNTTDSFQTVDAYVGRAGQDRQTLNRDPAFAALSGSSRTAIQRMQEQFLPLDEFGVARIGVSRRSAFEEQVAVLQPAGSRLKLQLSSSARPRAGAQAEAEGSNRRSVGPVLSWNPTTGSLHLSRQATQQLFRRLGGRLTERSGSGLTVFFPVG